MAQPQPITQNVHITTDLSEVRRAVRKLGRLCRDVSAALAQFDDGLSDLEADLETYGIKLVREED
jgi:hypothetical protein